MDHKKAWSFWSHSLCFETYSQAWESRKAKERGRRRRRPTGCCRKGSQRSWPTSQSQGCIRRHTSRWWRCPRGCCWCRPTWRWCSSWSEGKGGQSSRILKLRKVTLRAYEYSTNTWRILNKYSTKNFSSPAKNFKLHNFAFNFFLRNSIIQ